MRSGDSGSEASSSGEPVGDTSTERTAAEGGVGTTAPPPPPPARITPKSSGGIGKVIGLTIVAWCLAVVAFFFVLLPLVFFVPSFWGSAAIALAVVVAPLWFIGRKVKARWLAPVGAVLFLLPIAFLAIRPLGDEPRPQKPEPWDGAAWQGTEVQYWDLSTGSRIGYVHFVPDNPVDAAPVMFLHGGPGGGVVPIDGDFARQLSDNGFEVYLFDQAGVGWSDLLEVEEYTVDRMVADLEAIRVEIGTEQMNLVGHSWGGSYAAHYMASHDEHVERAWLSNPGEYGGTYLKRSPEEEPNLSAGGSGGIPLDGVPPLRLGMAFALNNLGAKPGAVDDLANQVQFVRLAPGMVDAVAAFQDSRCADNPYEASELEYATSTNFNFLVLTHLSDDVTSHDETEGLETIETPVVIARGVCDYIPWDGQRVYRDTIPGAQLIVIPNEGHDMRPAEEISAFFGDGDPGVPAYTSNDVPSP